MSVTIGSATFSTLTAQPFGYEETDTRFGLTAQKWLLQGLLSPAEWLDLLDEYNDWRDARITDAPTEESGVVGTTIVFSGDGPGGQSWTNVACWFISAPQAEQVGHYLSASVELVDAAQALEVILKQKELQEETSDDLPDLGTVVVGTTTLKLVKPMESYGQGPALELTAAGRHYVTGPLVVYRIRDIEGTTNAAGWAGVLSWYESQIIAIPSVGTWFPISIPTASAENKIVDGVKTVEYTVSIQLGQVR